MWQVAAILDGATLDLSIQHPTQTVGTWSLNRGEFYIFVESTCTNRCGRHKHLLLLLFFHEFLLGIMLADWIN